MKTISMWGLRLLKIVFAVCLVIVTLWALLLPPFFPSSAHSIVNAEKVVVEALDGGVISEIVGTDGSKISAGDTIVSVLRDQSQVVNKLKEFVSRKERLQEERLELETKLIQQSGELESIKKQEMKTNQLLLESLEQKQKITRARITTYSEELIAKQKNQALASPLFKSGTINQSQWAQIQSLTNMANEKFLLAENELFKIENELINIRGGVRRHHTSASEALSAQIISYQQKIRDLEVQKINVDNLLQEVSLLIASSRSFLESDKSYDITSPVSGLVLEKYVSDAKTITVGQDVMEIADSDSLFIEAFFNRSYMDRISEGGYAHMLMLKDNKFIEGRVTSVKVQEKAPSGNYVINSISPDISMLKVVIEVDKGVLDSKDIGEITKVLITSAEPDFIERTIVWVVTVPFRLVVELES